MLQTYIDTHILEDFERKKPEINIWEPTPEEEQWRGFLKYLKTSSIVIYQYPENQEKSHIFKLLTDGIEEGKLPPKLEDGTYNNPVEIIRNSSIFSVFYLDISDNKVASVRNKKGRLIGIKENYIEQWQRLELKGKKNPLLIRKDSTSDLKSWNDIEFYVLPFSDMVIYDKYIIEWDNPEEPNILKLIEVFSRQANSDFNVLIITAFEIEDNKPKYSPDDYKEYYEGLVRKIKKNET